MRQGQITRPPRRQVVMEIADYLNCTLAERNRLLIAASATPVSSYLTGAALDERLTVTREVAESLTTPTIIINRDWRILYINDLMLALNGLTPAHIAHIPPEQLNFLRLMFDPSLPLHPKISRNRVSWERMARQTMYGFKMANQLCQYESWYQILVDQFHHLPEFSDHWFSVKVDSPFEDDPSAQSLHPAVTVEAVIGQDGATRSVWLRPLVISAGYFQFDFPQILSFVPADESSRAMFTALGA